VKPSKNKLAKSEPLRFVGKKKEQKRFRLRGIYKEEEK